MYNNQVYSNIKIQLSLTAALNLQFLQDAAEMGEETKHSRNDEACKVFGGKARLFRYMMLG